MLDGGLCIIRACSDQEDKESERNQEASNPYCRKIVSNLYLVYPKLWKEKALKHTDLVPANQ